VLRVSPIRRPAVVAALAFGLVIASTLADQAGAQDVPSPPSSDPSPTTSVADVSSTSEPTTTSASTTLGSDSTATTQASASRPEETTTIAAAGASTSVPDTSVVPPPPPDGVIEGQTESVPIVPAVLVELPTRGSRPAKVVAGVPTRVTALIRAAQDANKEMQARLSEAEMRNAVAGHAVDTAKERVDKLSTKQRAALAELSDARRVFEDRVRWAYTRGPTASLEGFLQSSNATQLLDRRALVEVVLEGDSNSVSHYLSLRDSVDGAVSTADDILSQAEHEHASTQIAEDAARGDAALTTLTVGLWQRAQRGLRDIVFPVLGPHAFGSDFGAPRMVGTPDQHTHEGNDIAAPLGAQLVSVEPGMVVAMGTDRLGGIKLWLAGRSGTYYYYAHLSKFADEVHEGDIVPAGTVVGYVGNTGNAAGGIPHLHFEIHPNGGPAVDPYQYLATADRRQKTAKWP
jgi:murein DD-endopeptidase MepM/ murein hydrolase activator NlpD